MPYYATPEENPYEIVDGFMTLKDRPYTLEKFVKRATEKHHGRYTYENTYVHPLAKGNTTVTVTCKEHGDFLIAIYNHLSGYGCKKCRGSKGEKAIMNYLDSHNIVYECEKVVYECRNPLTGSPLRFDFYVPAYRLFIEYDGEQHYHPTSFSSDRSPEKKRRNLEYNRYKDGLKNDFIVNKSQGLHLFRIPYTDFKDIDRLLDETFAALPKVEIDPIALISPVQELYSDENNMGCNSF